MSAFDYYHLPPGEENLIVANAETLSGEIKWLEDLINRRIMETETLSLIPFKMNNLDDYPDCYYKRLINQYKLLQADRFMLLCAITPHIMPEIFTRLAEAREAQACLYRFDNPKHYIPTLQTVLYLMSGKDFELFQFNELTITEQSRLVLEQIIKFSPPDSGTGSSYRHDLMIMTKEFISYLIYGKKPRPDFGKTFPASLMTTKLDWDDLVVDDIVMGELRRIRRWSEGSPGLLERSEGRINGAFPCLFHGPSGNGKTLAAQLLGKYMGVDVFKIDLSMVVSKYIGETEKNLATLFDRARNKNWILFFDEADSLFGKRTNISDAKDKWANLEMSYLLQRMEEHKGLTILATNHKGNLDHALSRRFQSSVHFPRPNTELRKLLWIKLMPQPYFYDENIGMDLLAKFDLTGANIANCIKAACLEAECKKQLNVEAEDLKQAIMREFQKEGRSWT